MLHLGVAAAQEPSAESSLLDSGPLQVRDRYVLNLGLLVFEPSSPRVLVPGRWRFSATASLFNSWSQSDNVRNAFDRRERRGNVTLEELNTIQPIFAGQGLYHGDGQIHSVELALHRGLGRGIEVWMRGALIDTSGGFTDSLVETVHETLGFPDASRENIVRNEYTVYLRSQDGQVLYQSAASAVELGDLALGARKELRCKSDHWAHAVEAALGVPTGSATALAGSGAVDLGIRYLAELRLRRFRVRGSVGAIHHGSNDTVFLDAETLLSFWLGLERSISPRTSLLLQTSVGQSRYKDTNIRRLRDRIFLADFGLKRRLRSRGYLYLALTQNFNRGSSSDFGLHLGWMRDF